MNIGAGDVKPVAEKSAVAAERLERLRTKLLDLSTTNRMLSFRHPSASCIRVVDELPEVVFESLLQGNQLTFEHVEEPSQRELEAWHASRDQVPRANDRVEFKRPDPATWARHLGIGTDYNLIVETDSFLRLDRHSDAKLQTLHYQDELDTKLRKIRAAARTAIEESGANMLYLAFGFLEWRDQSTSKAHQAPLLLLPVELTREQVRAGRYRTKIRWTNEELQPNLSLQKKLDEFGVKLPDWQEDQKLETYLADVARAVRHKTDWLVRRYTTLGLFEFGKILLYLDLDPDRWPAHTPIDGHPLVRAILEGGTGDEGDERSTSENNDYSPALIEASDLHLELVDRADSSQCEALQTALRGQNLVIEGPPGTGKSQTITNLIAAALARGKTVLFVAEKLAALQVVRRRMRELGLGDFCLELHSNKTRKSEVLDDVADRIRASAYARSAKDLDIALTRLAERRQKISEYIDIISRACGSFLHFTVGDALMSAGHARRKLGDTVKVLEAANVKVDHPERLTWAELTDAKSRVRQFVAAINDLNVNGSAYDHPWAGVSSTFVLPHDRDRIAALAEDWAAAADQAHVQLQQSDMLDIPATEFSQARTALQLLDQLRRLAHGVEDLAAKVEQSLGLSIPRTADGIEAIERIAQLAASAPLEHLDSRTAFTLTSGAAEWLRQHRDRVNQIAERRSRLRDIYKESAFSSDADDLEEWAAALGQRGLFARFGARWRSASSEWANLARPAHLKLKASEKTQHIASLRTFILDASALQADQTAIDRLGPKGLDSSFNFEGAIAVADWATHVRSTLPELFAGALLHCGNEVLIQLEQLNSNDTMPILTRLTTAKIAWGNGSTYWQSLLKGNFIGQLKQHAELATDDASWQEFLSNVEECALTIDTLAQAEIAFASATGLDKPIWFGNERTTLAGVSSRARLAASSIGALQNWLDFDRVRIASEKSLEKDLVHLASVGGVKTEQLDICLDFLVFDAIARQAFASDPGLFAISGRTLDMLREEYRELDAQVMELRRSAIASKLLERRPPEGRQSGLKSQLTEMALLRNELSKMRRHIPIRQLVARAGKSLQALKPCFMMGPLSVAQYIAPGTLKFDLIIMDEASQMRPEDAIGALARGGQAIIVGDPKQLPPTSFFDRISDRASEGEADEEVTLAEDSKSILELASSIFDQRMLRWHYRSRHEALIAFSNRQFYKDELIVFPSPAGQSDRFGIGWSFLADGVTTKGINPTEARAVAAAVAKFLVEHKNRSLGVVAMNIKQAQRIADELSALADRDPILAKALAEAENERSDEPFFIKNLENVQGDERDVIMISMTYGPATLGGRTPQNFGPINQDTGWRRLNVLFTRAKERMEIFSSMRSSDVVPKEGSDRGPRALKLFLDYAENGSLGVEPVCSDRPTGSDFEDAVLEGLRELNFECVPQVGVANFFLDIGVRDPASPGEFIAAVECDGASYHSSKSARDRDRLRQEILENLGWNIIRIWSTDWFRDPNGELNRVVRELHRLIEARKELRARREEKKSQPLPKTEVQHRGTPQKQSQTELFNAVSISKPKLHTNSDGISVEQARAKLIDLRERAIKSSFPDSDPAKGLLRKSMLDDLLKKRPTDIDEFRRMVRLDLRQNTDAAQLKEFAEQVFDILAEVDD